MKKNILILFMLIGYSAFSTTWTVDNNTGAGAQFTSLQAAHDAATAGDTLLVKGSALSYGNLVISKEIHVIGEGLKPNKNQFAQRTQISNLAIATTSTTDASNSSVSGLFISGPSSAFISTFGGLNSFPLSGVLIERCYFKWSVRISSYTPGLIFNQCIFDGVFAFSETSGGSTWTIQNSLIAGLSPFIGGGNGGNRLVKNCVLIGTGSGSGVTGRTITFDNNIFYQYQANNGSSVTFCTFNNNLCFGNPDNSFPTLNGNTSNNNISGQDPQFVSAPFPVLPFDFNKDWNLQASSPGKNYGTDGTDIGIYGGSGFVEGGVSGSGFQTAPMPAIPQMLELNIQNPVVPENGNLNVKVVGRKQQ